MITWRRKKMTKQTPLPWLIEAFKHNGLKEIKGSKHNPTIIKWLVSLNAWWREDESAWCGVFVAHCLKTAMRPYPKNWYRALDYRKYGTKLDKPAYGCIATISRKGGGHVFFVVGQTTNGDIVGYGGNQSDAVNYRVFPRSQCQFCWPDRGPGIPSKPAAIRYQLPVYSSNLKQIGSMS